MIDKSNRRYMAFLTERATVSEGMGIFTTWGELTPCGEWVETNYQFADPTRNNVVRNKLDHNWGETPAAAMAAKAAKIRAIARRMLDQADELDAAAAAEKVTT
jgi:hypothetical protein